VFCHTEEIGGVPVADAIGFTLITLKVLIGGFNQVELESVDKGGANFSRYGHGLLSSMAMIFS
jgi:hypothetical protein